MNYDSEFVSIKMGINFCSFCKDTWAIRANHHYISGSNILVYPVQPDLNINYNNEETIVFTCISINYIWIYLRVTGFYFRNRMQIHGAIQLILL